MPTPSQPRVTWPLLDQALHDGLGHVDGDGEADAHVAAGAAGDGGVDADDLAVRVDQRAAAVAGVDGGVGLDEVLVVGDADVGAALGADDAGGDGLVEAERIADGEHPLADLRACRSRPSSAARQVRWP